MSKTLIVAMLSILAVTLAAQKAEQAEYKTTSGSYVVVGFAHGAKKEARAESTVEFYSAQEKLLCSMDLSSEDNEHGYGVVKAAWTPDEQYFVFSLASSGGHQPWHTPIKSWSLRDSVIRSLDSYAEGPGISKGEFALESPNIVLTEVWKAESAESVPAKFRLDSLAIENQKSHRSLRCEGGKVFRVDPYDLGSHE